MTESLLGATPPQDPTADPSKNYLEELVGEGKKFKSPADLARGKYEADMFIETLKRQQDELRADYLRLREDAEARAKLEDLIGQLESRQNTTPNNPPVDRVDNTPKQTENLDELLTKKLTAYENTKKEQENFQTVQTKLQEAFGDEFQRTLRSRINELGITEEYVNEQARKYPKALLKLIGVEDTNSQTRQNFQTPPPSTVRSDNFKPTGAEKRSWSWYQNLKRTDPKRYYDPKTNIQMHNDALALGESFQDGDFRAYGDKY